MSYTQNLGIKLLYLGSVELVRWYYKHTQWPYVQGKMSSLKTVSSVPTKILTRPLPSSPMTGSGGYDKTCTVSYQSSTCTYLFGTERT